MMIIRNTIHCICKEWRKTHKTFLKKQILQKEENHKTSKQWTFLIVLHPLHQTWKAKSGLKNGLPNNNDNIIMSIVITIIWTGYIQTALLLSWTKKNTREVLGRASMTLILYPGSFTDIFQKWIFTLLFGYRCERSSITKECFHCKKNRWIQKTVQVFWGQIRGGH